jgi:hypothetical protein
VADLLAVPMDIILCEATQAPSSHKRGRNLLLSGEAMVFLRVSQLAYEMDVLLDLASQALRQRLDVDRLEHSMTRPHQPYRNSLLAIIPLLHVHGRDVSNRAIQRVHYEVGRVMQELAQIAVTLHQSSEQNWNVAESLRDSQAEDIGIPSRQMQLETEKRAISEVQDELETRIQNLTGMAFTNDDDDDDDNNNNNASSPDTKKRHESDENNASSSTSAPLDAFALAVDQENGAFISMNEFCRKCLPFGGIVKPTKEKNDGEKELVERKKEVDHVVDTNGSLAQWHNSKDSETIESREDLDGTELASQQLDPVQENHGDTMNGAPASTRGTPVLQRQLTPLTESVNDAASALAILASNAS